MSVLLPPTIAIKTVGTVDVYKNYKDDSNSQATGFIKFNGGNGFSPLAKFEVVAANTGIGMVHIRYSHNKKFLRVRAQGSVYISPEVDESEEDKSKWSCTLLQSRPVDGIPDHVQSYLPESVESDVMIDSVPALEIDHGYSYTTVTVEKVRRIVNLKLKTCEMYFIWKMLFEHMFDRYKLTGIVNGREPCPDPFLIDKDGNITNQVNPAFDVWHEKDQKIITWIKSTLSEDVVLLMRLGVHATNPDRV
ncbi:hypothetical protein ABKV19_003090 [Rosa sericea]